MDLAAVAALGDELLDWRYKGMPPDRPPVRLGELGAQGWDALGGDLALPVMLLSEPALQANVDKVHELGFTKGSVPVDTLADLSLVEEAVKRLR